MYNTSQSSSCNIAVVSEREQDQRGNMLFPRAIGPFPVRTRTTRAIAPLIQGILCMYIVQLSKKYTHLIKLEIHFYLGMAMHKAKKNY